MPRSEGPMAAEGMVGPGQAGRAEAHHARASQSRSGSGTLRLAGGWAMSGSVEGPGHGDLGDLDGMAAVVATVRGYCPQTDR